MHTISSTATAALTRSSFPVDRAGRRSPCRHNQRNARVSQLRRPVVRQYIRHLPGHPQRRPVRRLPDLELTCRHRRHRRYRYPGRRHQQRHEFLRGGLDVFAMDQRHRQHCHQRHQPTPTTSPAAARPTRSPVPPATTRFAPAAATTRSAAATATILFTAGPATTRSGATVSATPAATTTARTSSTARPATTRSMAATARTMWMAVPMTTRFMAKTAATRLSAAQGPTRSMAGTAAMS